jgi:hypothetical protein
VRAIVVPTAMDLGLSVRFDNDQINDPVMNMAIPVRSISQLYGNMFEFHKEFMRCLVQGPVPPATNCVGGIHLSNIPEDPPGNELPDSRRRPEARHHSSKDFPLRSLRHAGTDLS